MTDSTDPFADEPTPAGSVTVSRTTLLVALGLLGATAALLVVARSLQQTRPTTSSDTFVMGDDWKVSLQHLADAVTLRLNGIGDRLEALESRAPIGLAHVVDVPPVPGPVSVNGDGDPVTGPHSAANEPSPPPRNAAVSVPDTVPDIAGRE